MALLCLASRILRLSGARSWGRARPQPGLAVGATAARVAVIVRGLQSLGTSPQIPLWFTHQGVVGSAELCNHPTRSQEASWSQPCNPHEARTSATMPVPLETRARRSASLCLKPATIPFIPPCGREAEREKRETDNRRRDARGRADDNDGASERTSDQYMYMYVLLV